jgi:hypothetical protein
VGDGQEVSIYLPPSPVYVGERLAAVLALRNPGGTPLTVIVPCGNYFQLEVDDGQGQVRYDWTHERYPPRPGMPSMPPCPRGERPLLPGEAVQVTIPFEVPAAGLLRVVATRFGQAGPIAEITLTAQSR